jgi:two-component system cell cycle response regulator DivK
MTLDILMIEDNAQNRYLAAFLLEQRGHRVRAAADGASGVEMAGTQVPDIILLDIQLPGMDGYAVARALRQIGALRHTPIVAVTSYAMPGDREKCFAAGCDGYVEKPISPETFVDEVEAFHRAATSGEPE